MLTSLFFVLALVHTPPPASVTEAQCRPYFHDACSEAMGKWLPYFGWWNAAWQAGSARRVAKGDAFRGGEPDRGTFFVYGSAGPPRGHAFYDASHRIAFYEQGCCSWHQVVAAANVPPPPKMLASRDLRGLQTLAGARLGMTPAQVTRIYGPTHFSRVPGQNGVRMLAYTAPPPKTPGFYCDAFENFYFRDGRLMLIDLTRAC
ncbi:MAG: hypothetical protein ABR508_10965 [Candidatus Baltobacteraceae bacterium]